MLGKQKETPKRILEKQLTELAEATAKKFLSVLSSDSDIDYAEVESYFFDKFQTAFVMYCQQDIEAFQKRITQYQKDYKDAQSWSQGARASQTARANPTA